MAALAALRTQSTTTPFGRRFGSVGQRLASFLPMFSLDVVGLVASYAVCGAASAGAKPIFLFAFGGVDIGRLSGCTTMAVNPADGTCWVSDMSTSHPVTVIFTAEGKYISHFQCQKGYGIAFSAREAFMTEFAKGTVAVFSFAGKLLRKHNVKQLDGPCGIAYFEQEIFVADFNARKVVVLTTDGAVLRVFGSHGSGDGQFLRARGVAVSAAGDVFVTDNSADRVQVFSRDGRFLRTFGKSGSLPGQLKQPRGITFDRASNVIIADSGNSLVATQSHIASLTGNFRLQALRADGALLSIFGEENVHAPAAPVPVVEFGLYWTLDHETSERIYPFDVSVGPNGFIYVADSTSKQVRVYGFTL